MIVQRRVIRAHVLRVLRGCWVHTAWGRNICRSGIFWGNFSLKQTINDLNPNGNRDAVKKSTAQERGIKTVGTASVLAKEQKLNRRGYWQSRTKKVENRPGRSVR